MSHGKCYRAVALLATHIICQSALALQAVDTNFDLAGQYHGKILQIQDSSFLQSSIQPKATSTVRRGSAIFRELPMLEKIAAAMFKTMMCNVNSVDPMSGTQAINAQAKHIESSVEIVEKTVNKWFKSNVFHLLSFNSQESFYLGRFKMLLLTTDYDERVRLVKMWHMYSQIPQSSSTSGTLPSRIGLSSPTSSTIPEHKIVDSQTRIINLTLSSS